MFFNVTSRTVLITMSLVFLNSMNVYSQQNSQANKIGMTKEFTGWLYSYYDYDMDRLFTVIDEKNKKVDFYFNAGSCQSDGDPYS
jgi:hypothetical protein